MRKIESGSPLDYAVFSFADMLTGRATIVADHMAYLRRDPFWFLWQTVRFLDGGEDVNRLIAWVKRREYTHPTYADIRFLSHIQHWPAKDRLPNNDEITLFDRNVMTCDVSLAMRKLLRSDGLDPQFLKQNSWRANRVEILWRLNRFPELDTFYLIGIDRDAVRERQTMDQPVLVGNLFPQPQNA